jgi:UDP-GlcNAc:undecaprenyl-phosphate/decaprenyl-phosphate GlcNAc-1-phosphate transferase
MKPAASRRARARRHRPGKAALARPAAALANPAAALAAGTAAAGVARAAYSALTRRPPGGAGTWTRTNHLGDQLTLLEGPALTVGSVAVSALEPGLPPRVRAALAVAGTGAAAFGGYDDLAGSGSRRGFRGHLGALAKGEVTTGAVKLGGIGATGLVSAALLGGGPADVALNAGLVAGGANLLNLFDLRPGRALKVALASGTLLAVGARWAPARRGAATRPGVSTAAGPGAAAGAGAGAGPGAAAGAGAATGRGAATGPGAAIGPGAAAGPGAAPGPDPGQGALLTVAAPLGAAIALLPEDLGERAMLGDAGANALGALLGVAAAASLSRPARLALLAAITGLTAASEVVSFTAVIERTPALRWLDMLGRRPVPAAPVPGRDDLSPAEPRETATTAAAAPS